MRDENVVVDDALPDLGPPLMAKIIDGASGQNVIEVKLKHRRARCLLYYLNGDTSKLGQPNDQAPNRAVVGFIRRGSARYKMSLCNECSFTVRYHLQSRRAMLAEGRNEAIPVMPFRQLCTIIGNAIKEVSSENIKKSFKQTLFSLNPDGSEDSTEGSKRLNQLIADAPAFEDLPDKYKIKVNHSKRTISHCF